MSTKPVSVSESYLKKLSVFQSWAIKRYHLMAECSNCKQIAKQKQSAFTANLTNWINKVSFITATYIYLYTFRFYINEPWGLAGLENSWGFWIW